MKRLEEVYNEAYKTAIEEEKKWIEKLTSLPPDAPEEKRKAFANEVIRRQNQTNKIATEIAKAGESAAQIIQNELTEIYSLNYDFTTYSINRQSGLALDWTIYDRNQIAVLVQKGQSPFTKIAYKNLGNNKIIVQRLQNQLIQSVVLGESQPQIIRRIKTVTGQSTKQAKRVAQTERNRVQSQARDMGINEAVKMGLEVDKQWVARLRNTRELHIITHLEIVPAGKSFSNGLEYPGDPSGSAENVINCFCYEKPVLRSASSALAKHRAWAQDKGFERYRNEKDVVDKLQSYAKIELGAEQVDINGLDPIAVQGSFRNMSRVLMGKRQIL